MADSQGSAAERENTYADPYSRIAFWTSEYEELRQSHERLLARVDELEAMLKESGEHDRAEMWRAKANGLAARVAGLESAIQKADGHLWHVDCEPGRVRIAREILAAAGSVGVQGGEPE